jgi:hypothetical protein
MRSKCDGRFVRFVMISCSTSNRPQASSGYGALLFAATSDGGLEEKMHRRAPLAVLTLTILSVVQSSGVVRAQDNRANTSVTVSFGQD